MKKILLFIIISLILSSCVSKGEIKAVINKNNLKENSKIEKEIIKKLENVFLVIPHHNLVNSEIDSYYKSIKEKYKDFDNIVIISPNHFTTDFDFSFPEDGKYCYKSNNLECVNGRKIDYLKNNQLIPGFEKKDSYIEINEHGIGNHFQFINKYFKDSSVYGIILKINTKKTASLVDLGRYLDKYDFPGNTLFIASVDFSHHVNEKVAVFHDMKTLNFFNGQDIKEIEVDCPNCLHLIKDLANFRDKNYFDLFNRSSVDKKIGLNSNYQNTTHIYGEFTENNSLSYEKAFSGAYTFSKFEDNSFLTGSENEIFGMFFGDTHFTRGFTYNSNKNTIEDYLSCFYSNNDKNKNPIYWHNRMFYSFDFVGINLETSVGNKNECVDSNKSIVFRTNPEYLNNFKDIGINLYNLANNHSYDCGKIGYDATKKYLENNELNFFGDGRENEENIFKTTINGTKIAFLGFNDIGINLDSKEKAKKIKTLSSQRYIVVVNIHRGYEYSLKSNKRQKEIAKYFIDNGAKLIIGHHPHVVQEYEIYKGVPIIYSLGNFIFDQPFENTLTGYSLIYAINGEGVKFSILEFKRDPETYKIDCDSFK